MCKNNSCNSTVKLCFLFHVQMNPHAAMFNIFILNRSVDDVQNKWWFESERWPRKRESSVSVCVLWERPTVAWLYGTHSWTPLTPWLLYNDSFVKDGRELLWKIFKTLRERERQWERKKSYQSVSFTKPASVLAPLETFSRSVEFKGGERQIESLHLVVNMGWGQEGSFFSVHSLGGCDGLLEACSAVHSLFRSDPETSGVTTDMPWQNTGTDDVSDPLGGILSEIAFWKYSFLCMGGRFLHLKKHNNSLNKMAVKPIISERLIWHLTVNLTLSRDDNRIFKIKCKNIYIFC